MYIHCSSNQLEKAIGDLNTLTSSMRATDSVQQRELDSIRDGTNDLAIKFGKLRDRINQEIANKQVNYVKLTVISQRFNGIFVNVY